MVIRPGEVPPKGFKPAKPKYIIPRECLDAKGNLKPDSPCAEKMRQARKAKP